MSGKWLLPLLCVCAASLAGWTQETPSSGDGLITGVVLTESGQPANDVQVCTSILRGDDSELIDCNAKTDSQGQFTVERLGARTYKVFAINEAEGYSIQNQRFTDRTVTVGTNPPWPNVTIRQWNKGG